MGGKRKHKSSKASSHHPKPRQKISVSSSAPSTEAQQNKARTTVENTSPQPKEAGGGPLKTAVLANTQDTLEKDRCIERLISSLQAPRTEGNRGEYIERLISSISDLMKLEGDFYESELEKSEKLEQVGKELEQFVNPEKKKKEEEKREEDKQEQICACCKEPASTRCTGCRLVFYCDRECQRKDWKSHKDICRSYTVRMFPSPVKISPIFTPLSSSRYEALC